MTLTLGCNHHIWHLFVDFTSLILLNPYVVSIIDFNLKAFRWGKGLAGVGVGLAESEENWLLLVERVRGCWENAVEIWEITHKRAMFRGRELLERLLDGVIFVEGIIYRPTYVNVRITEVEEFIKPSMYFRQSLFLCVLFPEKRRYRWSLIFLLTGWFRLFSFIPTVKRWNLDDIALKFPLFFQLEVELR